MISQIIMPKLGETMEEGKIERWLKKEGDFIKKGEPILEMTTDKATFEFESPQEGYLKKIVVQDGQTVPVTDVIGFIGDKNESVPDAQSIFAAEQKKEEIVLKKEEHIEVKKEEGRIFISPRAKTMVKEKGIDITKIRGTGPQGRIVEKDVLEFIEKMPKVKITPVAEELIRQKGLDRYSIEGSGEEGKITKEDVLSFQKPTFSSMRKIIAEKMVKSKTSIPHFYITISVDMTHLMGFRSLLKSKNMDVGYNDFIVKAVSYVIKNNPYIASVWTQQGLELKQNINIGIAVAIEDGLIVPVIKDADKKSLSEISAESKALIGKARDKKLLPDEYRGSVLTVSNLGMFGVESFSAIIIPGESAILAIGSISKQPVVSGDKIIVRDIMHITLSADHRVIDGVLGSKFLQELKQTLEFPGIFAL
ncbi:hypothetical protein B9J78_04925 [bacterium Unc6]|nr:hypothetical protein [bacterium Unc6]